MSGTGDMAEISGLKRGPGAMCNSWQSQNFLIRKKKKKKRRMLKSSHKYPRSGRLVLGEFNQVGFGWGKLLWVLENGILQGSAG